MLGQEGVVIDFLEPGEHRCHLCDESSLDVPLDRREYRGQHGIVYEWECRYGFGCQDPALYDDCPPDFSREDDRE